MDEVHLAGTHVVVHQLPVRRHVQGLAGRALKIAENFQNEGSVLGTEGFVGIHVGYRAGRLRRGSYSHKNDANTEGGQHAEEC
jgi:hypothetical protein